MQRTLAHETIIPEEPRRATPVPPQNDMSALPPPTAQQQTTPIPTEAPKTTPDQPRHPKTTETRSDDHSPTLYAPNPQTMAYTQPAPAMTYDPKEIPETITCPSCGMRANVVLEQHPSSITWIIFIFMVMCFVFLSWIPFVAKLGYDKVWKCEHCGAKLASQMCTAPIVPAPSVQVSNNTSTNTTTTPRHRKPSGSQY